MNSACEINANLKQGGLEIITIDMEVKWANEKGTAVLKNHVESVSYLVYDDYKDNYSMTPLSWTRNK